MTDDTAGGPENGSKNDPEIRHDVGIYGAGDDMPTDQPIPDPGDTPAEFPDPEPHETHGDTPVEALREMPVGTNDPNIVGDVGPTDIPPGSDPPHKGDLRLRSAPQEADTEA